LHCPGHSPSNRSLSSKDESSFHLGSDPLQSISPPFNRPTCRPELSSLRSSAPFNGILALAPCGTGRSKHHPGSALRFSQPLSGFPASSSSTALFHAAAVPRYLPSKPSPHKGRVPLSRPLAPSRLSTSVPERTAHSLIASGFPDSRAQARSCLIPPPDYGLPFRGLAPVSRSPWTANGKPFVTASFTRLGALLPLQVRS